MQNNVLHILIGLLTTVVLGTGSLHARQSEQIREVMAERVTFHEDSAVTKLLHDRLTGATRETVQVQGYRVQIYSSNRQQTAKSEAFDLEKRIQDAELHVPVYVLYTPPFWKVRLGDFRTQDEAKLLKEEIVRRMPELQGDTYVVRDQITVSK